MKMLLYTVLGSYVLTSIILFKYPSLLHKKKNVKFMCHHISHRGGAGESYENTMYAFKRAVAIGTEMLELDCHLTKDGKVVVSHDHNLLRSTGTNKNISDLDYKDLPLLKHRLPIDFDPDVEYVGSANEDERHFALLKEVFVAFPHIPINIDIKINNDELISKVAALIKEYNREDYTVWGNFSDEITKKCYKTNPNVNLLFSMQRVTMLIILMYTGLLPFVPLKETHLEIFLPSIYLRRKGGPIRTFLPLEKLIVRIMNMLLMRPCLFNHLRARGIHVYFWVLNKDEEFKHAFDLGATGVMTDYPSRLKSFLKNNALD
ncbi:lysophospholipase D GDPD1-like [Belonocnema kinseyi]|uniref:lysophospholipase D GDPD1-like n=1 Tax=Belonocnema kinseyi TaxID=2817044 RepID=UPI00143D8F5E|nr:lysophospholipase D GDPD1-like [Belonocnema kinseyi]XP_033229788.1 lysophospholipase D GDPD1-like [Belonocnema kinseyi]XP_033229789.1 lysophospholipase D GDPD1-like [Belonocnema kinseyi]XP_033229791.1 lysophospholipase D GDPD1-like [Belonocnema kinseyi]